jgi:ferredoxin-NADP reductase
MSDVASKASVHGVATIVRREDVTADLFRIWLQPEVRITFAAGQYVTIGADGIERPYSIVSAPYESLIELFIERIAPEQGGKLTPILHARRVGDAVTIRPRAKGRFTLRANVTHHVMVATVTGVAPYVSIIRQFLHDRARDVAAWEGHRFSVMHGASHRDEFVYDRELCSLGEQYSEFISYTPSLSRPGDPRNAGWRGAVGRINLLLEDHLARWMAPKDDTCVYLCGNPGMIEDVKFRLGPSGWSIAEEQYWTP